MRNAVKTVLVVAAMVATPAVAQQADVNGYLCTVAGKCGTDAAPSDDAATKAAPDTKGFRIATAQQQQPTTAAPETKGFRLARPQDATQPAPATKSFRLARTTPVPTSPRIGSPSRRYAASRALMAARVAPVAGPRSDLMLTFPLGSDQMTPGAEQKARGFAQALNMAELKDKRFRIEGHTDARGARTSNIELSRRRAQSVADFLVAQGVDRNRVEVKGVGPDEPLPGQTPAAEANRRVEAVLLS